MTSYETILRQASRTTMKPGQKLRAEFQREWLHEIAAIEIATGLSITHYVTGLAVEVDELRKAAIAAETRTIGDIARLWLNRRLAERSRSQIKSHNHATIAPAA